MRTSLDRTVRGRLRAAVAVVVASFTWVTLAITPAQAANEDTLSSLSFKVDGSVVTLSPSFAAGTQTYSIPSVAWTLRDSLEVRATPTDISGPEATLEWRIVGDGSGTYEFLTKNVWTSVGVLTDVLEAGNNVVQIRVTTGEAPTTQRLYSVTVPVAAPSTVTTFATFGCVSVCSLSPAFSPATRTYSTNWVDSASLDLFMTFSTGAVSFKAWRWDSPAEPPTNVDWSSAADVTDVSLPFTIGDGGIADGSFGDQPFEVGHTPSVYSFQVTAESGATAEYVLYVYSRSGDDDASLSALGGSNVGLRVSAPSALTLTQVPGPTAVFDAGVKNYTAAVAPGTTKVTLRAIAGLPGAQLLEYQNSSATSTWTVMESGVGVEVNLVAGTNVIKVRVRSGDGPPYTETAGGFTRQATYSVTITGGSAATANLTALTCTTCTLSPAFASGTLAYTSSVASTVASVNLTPTAAGGTVTCEVNGTAVTTNCASGSAFTANLNAGSNTVKVTVTPTGGGAATVYTITIARGATLTALSLGSACTLAPAFAPATTTYTCTVTGATTSVTPVATASTGSAASWKLSTGNTWGTGALALVVGVNTVQVRALPSGGADTAATIYTVTVTRQGDGKLTDLSLSKGSKDVPLTPAFSKDVSSYKATVAASSVTISATKSDASSTLSMTVNGTAVTFTGTATTISLRSGSNTVVVTVTPTSGAATTYTILIKAPACKVVNVVGMSFSEAKKALRQAHCGWTVVKVSSTKAKGTVLSQTPAYNATQPKKNKKAPGFKVALTISKG